MLIKLEMQLSCIKPGIKSLALHKPGVVVHTCKTNEVTQAQGIVQQLRTPLGLSYAYTSILITYPAVQKPYLYTLHIHTLSEQCPQQPVNTQDFPWHQLIYATSRTMEYISLLLNNHLTQVLVNRVPVVFQQEGMIWFQLVLGICSKVNCILEMNLERILYLPSCAYS